MKPETFIKGIIKTLSNPLADRFCPSCKGKGSFGVVITGEYGEEWQIVECRCVREEKESLRKELKCERRIKC